MVFFSIETKNISSNKIITGFYDLYFDRNFNILYIFAFSWLKYLYLCFFRFCDNVWTFMLNDVEFREVQEVAKVDKVKIVACDGKSEYYKYIDITILYFLLCY